MQQTVTLHSFTTMGPITYTLYCENPSDIVYPEPYDVTIQCTCYGPVDKDGNGYWVCESTL